MNKNRKYPSRLVLFACLASTVLFGGCASTQTQPGEGDPDPWEPANRAFFAFNETLDDYLVKPLAEPYADFVPQPVRVIVSNVFSNLTYPNVILNSFLQGKFDEGMSDIARFLVNSTIGLAGMVDVAKDMGLPAHDEDLGQTLAVWGAGQGPYAYLPIKGPSSVRDAPDMVTSSLVNPLAYLSAVTGAVVLLPVTALYIVNTRANLLDETRIRDEVAIDPYSFTREAYIQRREYLIYDGNPPLRFDEELFEDED